MRCGRARQQPAEAEIRNRAAEVAAARAKVLRAGVAHRVDQVVPVDVYAPGCPPTPETLIHAIMTLHRLIESGELTKRPAGGAGIHIEAQAEPIPISIARP